MPLTSGYQWTQQGLDYSNKQEEGYQPPSREQMDSELNQPNPMDQWDWQNEQQLGPMGQKLPELAQGWKPDGNADFGTGLGGWWKKAVSNVRQSWQTGYQEGIRLSGIEQAAIKTSAKGTGQDANKLIDAAKEERDPKSQNAAYWAASVEATKEIFDQALWGVLDGLSKPAMWSEQVIGTAGYTLADWIDPNRDVNSQTFKENWNASQLAYSGIFDATIFEEMNRRVESGIRPDLAKQDIMTEKTWTMWPEMIGQLVYDPLNVVSAIGKAGEQIKLTKNVTKTFHEVTNPAIASMLDNLDEIAKLDDAQAYGKIDELVKSQQGLVAATEHADDIAKAGKDLEALSNSYKLGSMTADGKIAHLANETGEILMHVVNNSSPDEALEILRGMVLSVSKNTDEAAEGVSAMLHFADPKALFSKAGNDTTLLLARSMEKYGSTWLDDIAKLQDNPAELVKSLLTKVGDVGEEMFPSVTKMLEAEKTIAQLAAEGKAIPEKLTALAERAKQLPEYVKAATRFHDTAQKVVGPINKFFVGAYMGWSPGFAFRNMSNNSLQLLIDYGPGVLLGKADDVFAKAEKLHGGIIQGAFSEGGQAAALFPEKIAMKETGVKAAIEAAKGKIKSPFLAVSQTAEANAAKRIIAKTYTQTFEKGTKAMVRALEPELRAAGFSDDIVRKLPTYIMQNDGDAARIIDAIRQEATSGVIDLFNDASRIDPKYKSFLSDIGKWDEYSEKVLKATTREEALAAADKMFNDVAQAGDYVYREGRPAVDTADKFLKLAENNGMPPTRGQLISLRRGESRKAIQVAESILSEADDLGATLGLPVGQMKKSKGITGLNTWGNDASKEADRLSDLAWKVSNESKKGGADLTKLWGMFSSDPIPANLTPQSFRDALWSQYDTLTSKTWGDARDLAMDNVSGYLDDLKAAGAPVKDEWYKAITTAQEGAQQYDKAMVGRYGELVEETPMAYGTRSTQIRAIADQNGVASVTDAGMPMDKKVLATINKYADVNYKSLEEVPLNVAQEAFAKKAGKLTGVSEVAKTQQTFNIDEYKDVISGYNDALKQSDQASKVYKANQAKEREVIARTIAEWEKSPVVSGEDLKSMGDGFIADEKTKLIFEKRGSEFYAASFEGKNTKSIKLPPDGSFRQVSSELITERAKLFNEAQTLSDKTSEASRALRDAEWKYSNYIPNDIKGTIKESGELAYWDEAGNLVEPRKRILPPAVDGEAPPVSRAIHEQMDKVSEMRKWVMDDVAKNFGKKQVADKVAEGALKSAEKQLAQKLAETRLISSRVAQANRDFTLLNYGDKSYWDTALAYLYPFHFWYKGTYANWMKRLVSNPSVLGHYSRYKQILGTVHADMPEWWKYNINTNDLPGVDVDNPLYFNLEATLWPLNGITGMDFNDSSKRTGAWTYGLEFLNKFGPSTWTPISMITGLALYNKGEQEAGLKWMGRLFPQSNVIKAGASLLGAGNFETDPITKLLAGGLDPYEMRRAQRALAQMEQEGNYTSEQIQDAAYSRSGPIWDEAVKKSVNTRAPSQISSFLFGVGFKGRTQQDMEIDKFQTDYGRLWAMRPNLTPQEFKEGMDKLKSNYPFMDTVMLSKRSGADRDAGLAYIVLTRIPPGKTSDIAEAVGISPDLLEKFYNDKGAIDKWSPSDQKKFMAGILDIAATLEIPSDMTRKEWTQAKNAYSKVNDEAKQQFGKDILEAVDGYYAAKNKSYDAGTAYLDNHPEVSDFMNWKAERIMNSPLLSAYYGGASQIEGYYRSQMYADIEKQLGKEIFDTVSEYNDLKTYGEPGEYKSFYNQHKAEIKQYYAMRDTWQVTINQETAKLSAKLPEGIGASIREDAPLNSLGAQNLAGSLAPQQQPSYDELASVIPERLMNLSQDYILNGEALPSSAKTQLGRLAQELGYGDVDSLLQIIGQAMYSQQP